MKRAADPIEILATPEPGHDSPPELPHMITPELSRRLVDAVADKVRESTARLLSYLPPGAAERAGSAVPAFFELYRRRPVKDNKGGSGFNDGLWIFAYARALDPEVIVESGVFKGHSTWLLRQACPDAEIHSFDVDLGHLAYRDPKGALYDCDWTEAALPALDGRSSLVFFDDHVDQARRLREAFERGFRYLLFDDNLPVYNLYATGRPPVPTLEMIMDGRLEPDTEVRWSRNGKTYRYIYREADTQGVRPLIEHYAVLPGLAPLTRHSPGSGLTAVKLFD